MRFNPLPTQTVRNGYGIRRGFWITWLKPGVNEKASHLKLNQYLILAFWKIGPIV